MNDDEPIDVLSGSSLNTFLRCARQWEYAYVYRYKRPPKLRMVLGTAGHAAAEVHLKAKRETWTDGPLDVALDAYSDSFDTESQDSPPDDEGDKGAWKDKGVRAVSYWHKQVAPQIQPDLIEEPIAITVNDLTYTGTIDVTTLDREVWDHKFTSRTPANGDAYLLNMVGYALGYRQKTGDTEARIVLSNTVTLKTKEKHVPIISDGPVTDAAIGAFADTLTEVDRSIQAGIFPPNGLKSGACSWCGYNDICPAYKESPIMDTQKETD